VPHSQPTGPGQVEDGPPVAVFHPVRCADTNSPVVPASDHQITDARRIAVGEVDLPDPAAALEAGQTALADGRIAVGALHLALVLRLAPALAPAVLDTLAPYDGPELALVKGDAYRLVGHERDARIAFADAAASIPTPATTPTRKERS